MSSRAVVLATVGLLGIVPLAAHASPRFDVATAGRTELGAGYQPVTRLDRTEPVASIELRPASGFRVQDHNYTWTTTYQQRWFLRVPNLADTLRPSLFHLWTTGITQQLTPRLTLQSTISVGAGTMDFTRVMGVLSSNTNTVPTARQVQALNLFTTSADATLAYQLTQRTTVTTGATATRQLPIGENVSLGTYTSTSARARHGYLWSPRTTQTTSLTASRIWSRPATAIVTPDGSTGPREFVYSSYLLQTEFAHQFTQRTSGTLGGGVSRFDRRGSSSAWYPTVAGSLTHLSGREGRRLSLNVNSAISSFVDTMTARLRTTANIGLGASRQLDGYWTLQGTASLMLPVSSKPVLPGRAESGVTANVVLTRRLDDYGQIDFGGRYVMQMTHPNDPDYRVLYRQSLAFIALSLWMGTDRTTRGRWAL
jgi:hypothetical protein